MSAPSSSLSVPDTPMWHQWKACKESAPECLLLFRLGDFFEAFHEDAALLSEALEVVLTHRQGYAMAGIPVAQLDSAVDRLLAAGHRVAIADQVGDAQGKTILERKVVRVVTPGTLVQGQMLQEKTANHLMALLPRGMTLGIAIVELSCGKVFVGECETAALREELVRWAPSEVLIPQRGTHKLQWEEQLSDWPGAAVTSLGEELFSTTGGALLQRIYQVGCWEALGIEGIPTGLAALAAALSYIERVFPQAVTTLMVPQPVEHRPILRLDQRTVEHLNLLPSSQKESRSLLELLDQTLTSMGGRLLRAWLLRPSGERAVIEGRWEAIQSLMQHPLHLTSLRDALSGVRDIERLSVRIACGTGGPRDLAALRDSLRRLPSLRSHAEQLHGGRWRGCSGGLLMEGSLVELLESAVADPAPVKLGEGTAWRTGFDPEYDRLLQLVEDRAGWLARYLEEERARSGCRSLRIGQHQSYGTYLEVPKGQAHRAPPHWQPKQSLTNVERFITEELLLFEKESLVAQEQLRRAEAAIMARMRSETERMLPQLRRCAAAIAEVDLYGALATTASRHGWHRPEVVQEDLLEIQGGRHPMVEASLPLGAYVASDCILTPTRRQMILTGPNMGGKSTYMRMVGLVVILAQAGSFVPARRMRFGLVDRLFTRIGASDDLTRGQSTFMVEMVETAAILHQATARSLVLLDEIGRGTGTSDGLAIAWAVAEELLEGAGKGSKTLFATHYLELTQLSSRYRGAFNAHVLCAEENGQVTFLHKVQLGAADRSYGLHVARLAGIPQKVVQRAQELQQLFDRQVQRRLIPQKEPEEASSATELSLF